MLAVLVLFVMSSVFYSCTKDDVAVVESNFSVNEMSSVGEINSVASRVSQGVGNTRNEFDYAGVLHNQILEKFVNEVDFSGMTYEEVLKEIKTIALANKGYLSMFKKHKYVGLSVDQVNSSINDFSNEFENVVNSTELSVMAKAKLNELLSRTFKVRGNYEGYRNQVIKFEEEIMGSNMSAQEKRIILSVSSIARYSGSFWSNHHAENVGGRKFFGWVIASDIVGGVLGGVFGGVAGAIGGASSGSSLAHTINQAK